MAAVPIFCIINPPPELSPSPPLFQLVWIIVSMPIEKPLGEHTHAGNTTEQFADIRGAEMTQARLSAIVESAEDAIISKTLEGVIMSWNKGAERMFGYTAEEAVGRPVTMLFPEEHINEEPAILARIRAGERVEHYETIRRRKDGTLLDISLTVSPIRGANGKIIGASKIARDITEQRRAQRALDEGATRLNLAMAAARMGDWNWDTTTDVVTLSETAAHIFGLPPDEPVTWAEMRRLLHADDGERARLAVEESLAAHG